MRHPLVIEETRLNFDKLFAEEKGSKEEQCV